MSRGVGDEDKGLGFKKPSRIIDREDDYKKKRRFNWGLSPDRHDAFAAGDQTPDVSVRTYADVMKEEALKREKEDTLKAIEKKKDEEEVNKGRKEMGSAAAGDAHKRRNRCDQSQDDGNAKKKAKTVATTTPSDWDMPDSTPVSLSKRNGWDETPTPGRLADSDATPAPKLVGLATPTLKRQRSKWDETPATMGSATPVAGATPAPGVTPVGGVDLATPTPGAINLRGQMMPKQFNLLFRWEKDIEERNKPLTDEEIDTMFPDGYKILEPPATYVPITTLLNTPTPLWTPLYAIPEKNRGQSYDVPKELPSGLPFLKNEDLQYFGVLLNEEDEEELSPEEQKERKIMKLLNWIFKRSFKNC